MVQIAEVPHRFGAPRRFAAATADRGTIGKAPAAGHGYFEKRAIFRESAPNGRALPDPQFGEADPRAK